MNQLFKKACASLLFLGAVQVYAADPASAWALSSSGPTGDASGTLATMLAAPPLDPKVIYLSTFLDEGPVFYQSTDDCKTWQQGTKLGLPADTAVALGSAVSDQQGNLYSVFADTNPMNAAEDKVFELSPGQKTWLQKPTTGLPVGWEISALAIDKAGNLYAGLVSGDLNHIELYELLAGGNHWVRETVPSLSQDGSVFIITALEVDHTGNLYVSIENSGVYKLPADKSDWVSMNQGLPENTTTDPVFYMQMLTDNSNNVYLASNYGVFQLTPGSTTWQPENQGLDDVIAEAQQSGNVDALYLSMSSNGALYLQTTEGVMQLQNNIWTLLPVADVNGADIYAVAVNAANKVCVSTAKGIFIQN